jgi:hypothetical protein
MGKLLARKKHVDLKVVDSPSNESLIIKMVEEAMPVGLSQAEMKLKLKISKSERQEILEKLRYEQVLWYDWNTFKWKKII